MSQQKALPINIPDHLCLACRDYWHLSLEFIAPNGVVLNTLEWRGLCKSELEELQSSLLFVGYKFHHL